MAYSSETNVSNEGPVSEPASFNNLLAWGRAQQDLHSHSSYVVMYFVNQQNGLFASPSYTQTQEQAAASHQVERL